MKTLYHYRVSATGTTLEVRTGPMPTNTPHCARTLDDAIRLQWEQLQYHVARLEHQLDQAKTILAEVDKLYSELP